MKSYKERLPMIDEAIDKLRGEFPKCHDEGDSKEILWSNYEDCFEREEVCTRQEFEQRKAELQNKPSWDDAPAWANWLAQGCTGRWYWWSHKPFASGSLWVCEAGENNHADFKMVAAAKGKVIGNWQDTLEQRPETINKEKQMNNDWYEKGELPPVGAVVDYEGTTVEVIAFDRKLPQVCARHTDGQLSVLQVGWLKPLRTETDKLVEQAMSLFSQTEATAGAKDGIEHAVYTLIEAGYRKVETE